MATEDEDAAEEEQEEEKEELQFDGIVRLEDREIQLILREVSGKDIALALKGAPEELRDCVFKNVSNRVATMIRDEMKLAAAAKFQDVQDMRSIITTIARGLALSGEITWPPSAVTAQEPEVESPPRQRPRARPPQPKKRSTRRTVTQVAGGLASAAVLVVLAILVGRFTSPSSTAEKQKTDRVRTVSSSSQQTTEDRAREPSKGTGGEVGEPQGGDGHAQETAPSETRSAASGTPSETASSGQAVGKTGQESTPEGSGRALSPGDQVQTEGNEPAVFEMVDGSGILQVEPHTNLEVGEAQPGTDGEEEPPRLDLRLGNIKVNVTDPELEVTSPLASVKATIGTQYRIRVVMDATTIVTVASGVVWLKPTVGERRGMMVLQPGDEARITPSGSVSVRKAR